MSKKSKGITWFAPSMVRLLVVILMILPAGAVSAEFQTEAEAKDNIALRIVYSGGLKGNIKPCG